MTKMLQALEQIKESVASSPTFNLYQLESEETALIVIDMVNGFAKKGSLYSPRVEALIPNIKDLMVKMIGHDCRVVVFTDEHYEMSAEFQSFPAHCLKGTEEAEVVDELKVFAEDYVLIPKDTTNGFITEEFQNWLYEHPQVNNFVIAGCCTDLCIQQFALSLKAYLNLEMESYAEVIVPVNCVDTYDLNEHNAELMNLMALYNMKLNGVNIVSEIEV